MAGEVELFRDARHAGVEPKRSLAHLEGSDPVVLALPRGGVPVAFEAARGLDVAVPVGAPDACRERAAIADEVVCVRTPAHFASVGQWYDDFRPTTGEEARDLPRRVSVGEPVHHAEAVP